MKLMLISDSWCNLLLVMVVFSVYELYSLLLQDDVYPFYELCVG